MVKRQTWYPSQTTSLCSCRVSTIPDNKPWFWLSSSSLAAWQTPWKDTPVANIASRKQPNQGAPKEIPIPKAWRLFLVTLITQQQYARVLTILSLLLTLPHNLHCQGQAFAQGLAPHIKPRPAQTLAVSQIRRYQSLVQQMYPICLYRSTNLTHITGCIRKRPTSKQGMHPVSVTLRLASPRCHLGWIATAGAF